MPCKYVNEFKHPKEFGFTGSAGKQNVKGYLRGGHVCADVKDAPKAVHKHEDKMHKGEAKTKFACGGKVKHKEYALGGGVKRAVQNVGKAGKQVNLPTQAKAGKSVPAFDKKPVVARPVAAKPSQPVRSELEPSMNTTTGKNLDRIGGAHHRQFRGTKTPSAK